MPDMTAEQQEELRKKIENMSPEELREFQKKQCIFCQIISGKVSAKKIYEDEKVIGILDINPGNPGHVLLMPKEHYMIMPQLLEEELKHIFIVAKKISHVLLKALDVRGTNIIIANGPAAGQRAQHFMIHIIPRKEGDGIEFELPFKNYSEIELERVAVSIRARLNQMFGIKEKEKTAEDILSERKNKEKKAYEEDANEDSKEEADEESENDSDEENEEEIKEKKEIKEDSSSETKKDSKEEADEESENDSDEENDDDSSEDDDEDDTEEETEKDDDEPKKEESSTKKIKSRAEEDDDIDLDSIARVLNGR